MNNEFKSNKVSEIKNPRNKKTFPKKENDLDYCQKKLLEIKAMIDKIALAKNPNYVELNKAIPNTIVHFKEDHMPTPFVEINNQLFFLEISYFEQNVNHVIKRTKKNTRCNS